MEIFWFGCDSGSNADEYRRRPRYFAGQRLRSMRGSIIDARPAYPQVLHLDIRDSAGEHWCLISHGAESTPTDPA
jgi:hypothetical protein